MIIGREVSSSKFDFNSTIRCFMTEASMIKGTNFLGRLYDDAYDQGFVLCSERTGKQQPYAMINEVRADDGDVLLWEFEPTYPILPGAVGTKVVVYND